MHLYNSFCVYTREHHAKVFGWFMLSFVVHELKSLCKHVDYCIYNVHGGFSSSSFACMRAWDLLQCRISLCNPMHSISSISTWIGFAGGPGTRQSWNTLVLQHSSKPAAQHFAKRRQQGVWAAERFGWRITAHHGASRRKVICNWAGCFWTWPYSLDKQSGVSILTTVDGTHFIQFL